MSINDKWINTHTHKLKKIPNLLKLKRKWMYKASCKYDMGLIIIKGHSCSFVYDKKGMYYKINWTTNANAVVVEAKKKPDSKHIWKSNVYFWEKLLNFKFQKFDLDWKVNYFDKSI